MNPIQKTFTIDKFTDFRDPSSIMSLNISFGDTVMITSLGEPREEDIEDTGFTGFLNPFSNSN